VPGRAVQRHHLVEERVHGHLRDAARDGADPKVGGALQDELRHLLGRAREQREEHIGVRGIERADGVRELCLHAEREVVVHYDRQFSADPRGDFADPVAEIGEMAEELRA
jgi:hypothetical protein